MAVRFLEHNLKRLQRESDYHRSFTMSLDEQIKETYDELRELREK